MVGPVPHWFLLKVTDHFRNMTSHTTAFQRTEKAPKAGLEQIHFSNFTGRLNTEMKGAGMPLGAIKYLGQSL